MSHRRQSKGRVILGNGFLIAQPLAGHGSGATIVIWSAVAA